MKVNNQSCIYSQTALAAAFRLTAAELTVRICDIAFEVFSSMIKDLLHYEDVAPAEASKIQEAFENQIKVLISNAPQEAHRELISKLDIRVQGRAKEEPSSRQEASFHWLSQIGDEPIKQAYAAFISELAPSQKDLATTRAVDYLENLFDSLRLPPGRQRIHLSPEAKEKLITYRKLQSN